MTVTDEDVSRIGECVKRTRTARGVVTSGPSKVAGVGQCGNSSASAIPVVGAVYTLPALADWTATQLLRYVPHKAVLRVLDPACGDGELLAGVIRSYTQAIEVCGRDIDPGAIAATAEVVRVPGDLAVGDSIRSDSLETLAWRPDAVIMNPPWDGLGTAYRKELRAADYELAEGQFDLYEIFVERIVKLFPSTFMAFILPDSVFLPEHARFRRFILENTQLLFMARLGEGLFPGICRATVVIVLRSEPCDDGNVECFRLRASQRTRFLNHRISLDDLRKSESHFVPISRFAGNPNAEFTIEIRTEESAVDRMMDICTMDWDRAFWIGRGVEIGKHGSMLRCRVCGIYRSVPKRQRLGSTACSRCGTAFPSDAHVHHVVRRRNTTMDAKWRAIIVGEDVNRYRCSASREMRMGLAGIRYKDIAQNAKPKLLVRKTGVGLRSAIDWTGALTTQTVYHFIAKCGVPLLVLDYLAGVLNSRVMLAFHLRWSGDIEWRSHPYVTPTVIKALPVPCPFGPGKGLSSLAVEIAMLARRRSHGENVEDQIEDSVAILYGLTSSERRWVAGVIASAQPLRGIAELREPFRKGSSEALDGSESGRCV